jgi:all-trans-retinol dehydrogenase (NAD+)
MQIKGRTVLITGGAAGLGAVMAQRALVAGAERLVLWDVDGTALAATLENLRAGGFNVDGNIVDVTNLERVQTALHDLSARSIHTDVLVNNAGIVVAKEFADHTHDDIERTMCTNALAPMHVTLEVLPGMIERGRGHIVNIASAAGLVSNPRMSAYCASKWAMIGWSDSLRLEMERSRLPVKVTTVVPYYIDTGMFAGVRSPFVPILRPHAAAERIVSAIEADRIVLRLPGIVNVLPLVRGLLPVRWFDRFVGDWLGVYDSMKTFKGKQGEHRQFP